MRPCKFQYHHVQARVQAYGEGTSCMIRVAVFLCPELVLSTSSTTQNIQLDGSCSWNFAPVDEQWQKKQRLSPRSTTLSESDGRHADHDAHAEDDARQVVISIFSTVTQNAEVVAEIPFIIKPLTGGLSNLLFIVENISSTGNEKSVFGPHSSFLGRGRCESRVRK